jgi:hypothetical protein
VLSEPQHNAFITSLLITSPTNVRSALQYLREFERKGEPLPQSSYAVILNHLTTPSGYHQTTSHTRAQAWELFTHMRLHGHSIPDAHVYSTMIRACADPRDPQPERARDLWIEMTQEGNQVEPTRAEYDAIIRALSSTKGTYLEAFDMLRQMLARHHDAVVAPFEDTPRALWSAHVPTLSTFIALLEGTKRAGDLERARWILSEVIGLVGSSVEIGQPMPGPNEELLGGLFMTYAAWKPPITRSSLKTKEDGQVEAVEEDATPTLDATNLERIANAENQIQTAESEEQPSTSSVPRSSADAIREATAVFRRILTDVQAKKNGDVDFFRHPFTGVHLHARLVNAYISVQLEHAATTAAMYKAWKETWEQVSAVDPAVRPNGWSYMLLLERCSAGRRRGETSEDRSMAAAWGKRVWRDYIEWSKTVPLTAEASSGTAIVEQTESKPLLNSRQIYLAGLGHRQVERCWKAAIKLYALTDHTDTSLALLREFTRRYPPEAIKKGYKPYDLFGMATRIVDLTRLPEPDVQPHLLFDDVDVLHQRLVKKEDWPSVSAVKSITKAYEHALLKRRKYRMKNAGVPKELAKFNKERALIEQSTRDSQGSLPPPAEEDEMDGQWDEFVAERRKAWG